ncbi:asparagine synthase (glutamine-hydrolyzing) [Litoricolaceae bacterium]|nr:asparagine synthase (glutamine-hydrolyzing) [Litorivicinaceae bacterium]
MCGFAAAYRMPGGVFPEGKVSKMLDGIAHRGPDSRGQKSWENCELGFVRLSIIDLKNGSQPICSPSGRLHMVFNGEIYNYLELRSHPALKNYKWNSQSDSEVLLALYEKLGVRAFSLLAGMYSILIFDSHSCDIIAVRDRFGIKPCLYRIVDNVVYFCSEIKPLMSLGGCSLDPTSVSSYLSFRYPMFDQSFVAEVKKVPPGTVLKFKDGSLTAESYWSPPQISQKSVEYFGGFDEAIEAFDSTFSEVLSQHLRADVPVGFLLSGGLDSSIVAAKSAELGLESANSYSIGFGEEGYDETSYAQSVADKIGFNHMSSCLSSGDYLDKLVGTIRLRGLPLSIPHEVALGELFSAIKQKNKVVLSGEGADELFGGYGRVQRSAIDFRKLKFLADLPMQDDQRKLICERLLGNSDWLSGRDLKDHFLDRYYWWSFKDKANILIQDSEFGIHSDERLRQKWGESFDSVKHLSFDDQILYMFQKHHLPCLLDRLDYLSMASGVEARVPFVDHRIFDLAARIPVEFKFKFRGWRGVLSALTKSSDKFSERADISKFILRKYGENLLPANICDRRKLGFPVPLDSWIKSGMRAKFSEILIDDRTRRRGFLNVSAIERLVTKHENLDFDFWGKKIWMLVNLELWLREFVDD